LTGIFVLVGIIAGLKIILEQLPITAPLESKPINMRARIIVWFTIGVLALGSLLLGLRDGKSDLTKATLTTDIYLQDGSGTYIPAGSNVEVLSHSDATARIRYAGRDVVVSMAYLKQ
jgi:hypothetical protein